MAAARAQLNGDPLAFVRDRELFVDLAGQPAFTEPYLAALQSFHERGARATIEAAVSATRPPQPTAAPRNARDSRPRLHLR